jgi:hypothetical protein
MSPERGPLKTPAPTATRVSIVVLWLLFLSNGAGALWRAYELVVRVRADKRAEFFWFFVLYPALLAVLDGLALLWLYRGRVAGRTLAAIIFLYFGGRIAWLAWSGGGPGLNNALERGMAMWLQGGIAIALILLAPWVFFSGSLKPAYQEGGVTRA